MADLLTMKDVSKQFLAKEGTVHAVRHVSLTLTEGEILGIVGLSGSGKSTVLSLASRMEAPDSGTISWPSAGSDFYRHVQMVFQDPSAAFSPRMTLGEFLLEPLLNFRLLGRQEAETAIRRMLVETGASPDLLTRLPHEVSGGQLQRIVIARALLVHPDIILFDEPTSALDVITQEKILKLIRAEHEKYHFAGIFVTHDLSVVQQVSRRVMVMENGEVVEILPAANLKQGLHPCTRKLMAAQIPEDGHEIPDTEDSGLLCCDGSSFYTISRGDPRAAALAGKEAMVPLSPDHAVRAYVVK